MNSNSPGSSGHEFSVPVLLMRDFLPQRVEPDQRIPSATDDTENYETFPTLIAHANTWLLSHATYSVCTCETVDIKLHKGQPRILQSSFQARGERPRCYMRALRVWVHEIREKTQPDQIDYVNLLPRWKSAEPNPIGDWLVDVKSEQLSVVVERFNVVLRREPWKGRIVTVNTFAVKFAIGGVVFPDRTVWRDRGYAKQLFLVGLRVFFVKGTISLEQVNFIDIAPRSRQSKLNLRYPPVETFPMVLAQTRTYLSHLPANTRPLNIQTLHFRQNYLEPVDTEKTNFSEDNMHSYQLKYLRFWYSSGTLPLRQRSISFQLHSKLFCPILIRKPGCFMKEQFETTPEVRARLADWLDRVQVKVASVETVVMRVFSGAELFEGFTTMHTWNRVIHHSNAAHSHRHNFLHGRTHHRHGVRHRESSVAAETFVILYRVYYFGSAGDPDRELDVGDRKRENSLEEYMLARSTSWCRIV